MNIYLDSGYLDMRKIRDTNIPFIFIVGGRGVGKTYGALDMVVEDGNQFMLMRRTQTQTDLINKPEFSPFKPLMRDKGYKIETKQVSKYNAGIYMNMEEEGGLPIGYTCALSTIANMRGFDASDVDILLWDEFIPEKHERALKNEAQAFFNAYETMNRNRELKGERPLQVIALANANDLANPIFIELGLVRVTQKMRKKGQETYINKERGIAIFLLDKSPISEQKSDTAIYRLTSGSDFEKMSIKNDFSGDKIGRVKSQPLQEYKPIVEIGDLCIYEHKSKRTLYASTHRLGSPTHFGTGDAERARFIRAFRWIWDEYMENNIEFEEYLCEILLTKAFK